MPNRSATCEALSDVKAACLRTYLENMIGQRQFETCLAEHVGIDVDDPRSSAFFYFVRLQMDGKGQVYTDQL